jgi:hypothetical protein
VLAFACPVCGRLVPFESDLCLHCRTGLVYDPEAKRLRALDEHSTRCANAERAACNWQAEQGGLCASCLLTRTRPSDADPQGLAAFPAAEAAKRRLLFELDDLRLPIVSWRQRAGGLAFELLSSAEQPVTTGHADGVITLDLKETDPVHRERMRVRLHEPYRTVLGHFRHEIGHYYQPILLASDPALERRSRELFGDEREDYQRALDDHYRQGPPADWPQRHVSAYATMHPWEDWAETFAHYLHLRDTLQTAAAYGVQVNGPALHTSDPTPLHSEPDRAHARGDFQRLLDAWIPLTYALNAINRSMGESDLYPFVLTSEVEDKLAFIAQLVQRAASSAAAWGMGN